MPKRLGEIADTSSVTSTDKALILRSGQEYLAPMPKVAEAVSEELEDDFAEKTKIISTISGTTLLIEDNTEYRLTNVSNLTINYPSGNFECWFRITTAASGTINIHLPTSQYIGEAPDLEKNGITYELSIKDGVVIGAEVGDGT